MDRHAADRLVENNEPEPHDPAHLADKEEIEQSIELWEKALGTELPSLEETEDGPKTRRSAAEQPLRAPLSDDLEVDPVTVEARDGRVPSPNEALRQRLRESAYDRIRVELPVRLPDRIGERPARRVYFFDRPVNEAGGSPGTLYALGEDGSLVPFGGGMQSRKVVEVIEKEAFDEPPPIEKTLTASIRSGIAHWSHHA